MKLFFLFNVINVKHDNEELLLTFTYDAQPPELSTDNAHPPL